MVLIKRSNHLISHHLWVTQYESYNRVTVQTELVRRLRQLKGMNYGLEFWSETHWYVLWKPRTQRLNFQPRSVSKKFGREFWTRILDQIFSWSWSNNSENFWFWSETIRKFLKIFSPGPVLDRQEWPIFRKHFIPVLFFLNVFDPDPSRSWLLHSYGLEPTGFGPWIPGSIIWDPLYYKASKNKLSSPL